MSYKKPQTDDLMVGGKKIYKQKEKFKKYKSDKRTKQKFRS